MDGKNLSSSAVLVGDHGMSTQKQKEAFQLLKEIKT